MQTVKGYYKQGQVQLLEPLLNVTEAELYIVVIDKSNMDKSGSALVGAASLSTEQLSNLKLQSLSGFAQQVLLDPAEDIWNDL